MDHYAAVYGVDSSFRDCRVERMRVRQLRLFADTLPARLSPQFYQRAFQPTCVLTSEYVGRCASSIIVAVVVVIVAIAVNAGTHRLCRSVVVVVLVVVVAVVVTVVVVINRASPSPKSPG